MHRELGEYLPVDLHVGDRKVVHQRRVPRPVLPSSGPNTGNPQLPQVPLFLLPTLHWPATPNVEELEDQPILPISHKHRKEQQS